MRTKCIKTGDVAMYGANQPNCGGKASDCWLAPAHAKGDVTSFSGAMIQPLSKGVKPSRPVMACSFQNKHSSSAEFIFSKNVLSCHSPSCRHVPNNGAMLERFNGEEKHQTWPVMAPDAKQKQGAMPSAVNNGNENTNVKSHIDDAGLQITQLLQPAPTLITTVQAFPCEE